MKNWKNWKVISDFGFSTSHNFSSEANDETNEPAAFGDLNVERSVVFDLLKRTDKIQPAMGI